MQLRLTVLAAAAWVALFQPAITLSQTSQVNPGTFVFGASTLQTTNPEYLVKFPSPERIRADVSGVDAMETAAKHASIFWQLRELIYNLALSQRRTDRQFTPDERRLEVEYRNARHRAVEPFGEPDYRNQKWFEVYTKYENDLWLRDEVFKKYFTPELRRAIYVALKSQMPTTNAPEGSRLTPPAGSSTASANPRTTSGSAGAAADGRLYYDPSGNWKYQDRWGGVYDKNGYTWADGSLTTNSGIQVKVDQPSVVDGDGRKTDLQQVLGRRVTLQVTKEYAIQVEESLQDTGVSQPSNALNDQQRQDASKAPGAALPPQLTDARKRVRDEALKYHEARVRAAELEKDSTASQSATGAQRPARPNRDEAVQGGPNTTPRPSQPSASAETSVARENGPIAEENKKITDANEIVIRTFKAGNEAIFAGRYDDAIAQYREGLAARADEPALLTNLSEALRRRGVDRYNAVIRDEDRNRKDAGIDAAKKDWSAAAQASRKAVTIIKGAATGDPKLLLNYAQNRLAALSSYAQAMRLVATKVDYTQASAAWQAYQDYIAVETDPAKKTKSRDEALQMLFDAGSIDLAMAEARKILATQPNHVDANRVLGEALFATGDQKNLQEAADHLQRYVDLAPETDWRKQSAKDALSYIKTGFNIEPRARSGKPRPPQRRP